MFVELWFGIYLCVCCSLPMLPVSCLLADEVSVWEAGLRRSRREALNSKRDSGNFPGVAVCACVSFICVSGTSQELRVDDS